MHPDVLHSFRHGEVPYPEQVPIGAITGGRQHVPLGERRRIVNTDVSDLGPLVHAVYYPEDLEFPTHMNTRTQEFTAKHADHEFGARAGRHRSADAGSSPPHLVFL